MKRAVGIEALAIAVPRRYVDIEELARARGVEPAKYTSGLGAREMAVADPGEDSVALAAHAGASSMAFPAISTGIFRFPPERAAKIAIAATQDALQNLPLPDRVVFCCFDHATAAIYRQLLGVDES